jgi:hypothetical protein
MNSRPVASHDAGRLISDDLTESQKKWDPESGYRSRSRILLANRSDFRDELDSGSFLLGGNTALLVRQPKLSEVLSPHSPVPDCGGRFYIT